MRIEKTVILVIILGTLLLAKERVTYEIVTGSKISTYYKIGQDLANYVAPDANIKLRVLHTNGSVDNVLKLISPKYPRVKFAIVQSDVLEELKRLSKEAKGQKREIAKKLVKNIRVIKPLFNEEIHILARKDSGIKSFSDLKNRRIFAGKPRSGTLMTTMLLYKKLFGEKLKNYEVATTQNGDKKGNLFKKMLKKLSHREIDVIIQVTGQPAENLNKYIGKDASKVIKFIPYTKRDLNQKLISNYYRSYINKDNYRWLKKSVPTLATKAFLITYNYKSKTTTANIQKFVESLNKNLSTLKRKASKSLKTPHPKWKQVSDDCKPNLLEGWKYHWVVNRVCKNMTIHKPKINFNNSKDCTRDDKLLGLCK